MRFVLIILAILLISSASALQNFTIAIIPDTQHYSQANESISVIDNQFKWLLENKNSLNLKLIIQVGDLVQDSNYPDEWQRINQSFSILDNNFPYLVLYGNHDITKDDSTNYFNYFPLDRFSNINGSYDNTTTAMFSLLDMNETRYGFLTLPFDPSDSILKWADQVVKNYSAYQFIIFTHDYMRNGFRSPIGENIYYSLIENNSNIFFVQSGHWSSLLSRESGISNQREDGSFVYQFYTNFEDEDNTGKLKIYHFNESQNNIENEIYSTLINQSIERYEMPFKMNPLTEGNLSANLSKEFIFLQLGLNVRPSSSGGGSSKPKVIQINKTNITLPVLITVVKNQTIQNITKNKTTENISIPIPNAIEKPKESLWQEILAWLRRIF